MKIAATLLLLLSPVFCRAEIFLMKDGARVEGEVTGEMDGALLISTRYGSLTVNRTDISERLPSAAPAVQPAPAAPAAAEISTAAPAALPAETPVSTAAPAALPAEARISTAPAAQDNTGKAPFVLVSLPADNGASKLVYYENGSPIASEIVNAEGTQVSAEGSIKDGVYTEFYDNGAVKTVKTMAAGKPSGALKAFYPTGIPQIEGNYLAGAKNGSFVYFAEDGSPLMEAVYAGDKLNGWKKEYGPEGEVKSEIFYVDDKPAAQPQKAAAPAARKENEEDSLVTARAVTVARGEVISFSLNGKYIGKARLDRDCNVLGQEGRIPDGAVKVYTREEKLQKELVFKDGEIKVVRVYEEGGPLKATYTVNGGRASAFTSK